ncbi:MAG: hypothetical protein FD149_34 [Rhodospirillaceae bacterium]|nr:MAG: hypothetical protein FD149_34 [Rhodospirillaceae bacterium]
MRLQKFGYRDSPYERPTQKWHCGQTDETAPCRLGPDSKGRCQGAFQCAPARRGERWECTRPSTAGGSCAPGPLPDGRCGQGGSFCVPVRTWRGRRRVLSVWGALLTIGLMGVFFSSRHDLAHFAAGDMAPQHRMIEDCTICHAALPTHPAAWAQALTHRPTPTVAAERCLRCHARGLHPMTPHTLPRARLAALRQTPLTENTIPAETSIDTVACFFCHGEHRGRAADLRGRDGIRCQGCHGRWFAQAADEHARTGSYPVGPSRITFNHGKHINTVFPAQVTDRKITCTTCHLVAEGSPGMRLQRFDVVCADCHQSKIDGTVAAVGGVPFLSLPGLDLETLRQRAAAIGTWPESSTARLTPFMPWLLLPEAAVDLAHLDGIVLRDLTKVPPETIAAVERLAWAIKNLVQDLIDSGDAALAARLQAHLGHAPERNVLVRLMAGLPRDVLMALQREWLAALPEEITRFRAGERVVIPPASPPPRQEETLVPVDRTVLSKDDDEILPEEDGLLSEDETSPWTTRAAANPGSLPAADPGERYGGWYRKGFTLYYRPMAHADPFLRAWLEMIVTVAPAIGNDDNDDGNDIASGDPGKRCLTCHSLQTFRQGDEPWAPAFRRHREESFITFDHAPHSLPPALLSDEGRCLACHPWRSPTATAFRPTPRQVCITCHVEGNATQGCTLCHRYHAGG